MPRLELNIDDQLMNDLTTLALAQRVSSEEMGLEALKRFVYSDANEQSADVYERHYVEAIRKAKALKPGTKFSLNGNHKGYVRLFTRDEWEAMKRENGFKPTTFGKNFLQYVADYEDIIEPLEKAGDNKQWYRRV